MLAILIALIVNLVVIFLASYIVPGVKLMSFITAVILAVVIGVANTFIHQSLILVGLPANFWTYGLLSFVFTGILIWGAQLLLSGLEVEGVKWVIIYALIISAFNAVVHGFLYGYHFLG